jgi:PUA domain protein
MGPLRASNSFLFQLCHQAAVLELRHRHRLRRKEIKKLADDLQSELGIQPFDENEAVDQGDTQRFQVVLVGNEAVGIIHEDKAFLTVRGLLKWRPEKRFVSIDEGAIRFICNGADVMGPGITDADRAIQAGEMVWVRDAKHQKPLAIGKALVTGEAMATKAPGKAVKNIHYVGDELWNLGVEG